MGHREPEHFIGDEIKCTIIYLQYNTIQYFINHATFRSEKRSLKHVRAKTMYTINTIQ